MSGSFNQLVKDYSPQLIKHTLCFCHNNDDILLLLRNKQPNKDLWNGLGGKIEEGEEPHDSALREINEESSLELTNLKHLGIVSWSYDKPGYIPYQIIGGMHIFWGEVDDEQRNMKDIHHQETIEGKLGWHHKDDVYNLDSPQIVENISVFLPQMVAAQQLTHHHFVYQGSNNFLDHLVIPFESK
jgi:8-oxo-dGTP diphosphatase